ncbi:glycoside hydrolase family 3 protein, partial [Streptomyces sp. SID8455]|nr:glycoside hydrolase family 3 protein [Streptomyces sp. SID8455]
MPHRTSRRTLLTATAAATAAAATGVLSATGTASAHPADASTNASTDRRLRRIIAGMSLEEKVGQ